MIEGNMRITLPLSEMSVQDKLEVMNQIWEDLLKQEEEVSSPSWHQDVLIARAARVERGESQFKDFAAFKEDVQKRIK